MLLNFKMENFRSFKDETFFTMLSSKQKTHNDYVIDKSVNGNKLRVLPMTVIYGANASGKSNFVRALDFMRRVTLMGTEAIRYNDRFFRIDPACKEEPGVFQMDFIAEKTIFFIWLCDRLLDTRISRRMALPFRFFWNGDLHF